mgnify:CR=1 FL=1
MERACFGSVATQTFPVVITTTGSLENHSCEGCLLYVNTTRIVSRLRSSRQTKRVRRIILYTGLTTELTSCLHIHLLDCVDTYSLKTNQALIHLSGKRWNSQFMYVKWHELAFPKFEWGDRMRSYEMCSFTFSRDIRNGLARAFRYWSTIWTTENIWGPVVLVYWQDLQRTGHLGAPTI